MLPAAIATATPGLMPPWLPCPASVGVFVATCIEIVLEAMTDCSVIDDSVVLGILLLTEADEDLTTLLGTLSKLGIVRAGDTVAVVDVAVKAENDHHPVNELDIPSDVSVESVRETALVPALGSVLAEAT